jgi:tripartite-type tricarboxylate transporter receptor subunit TctC
VGKIAECNLAHIAFWPPPSTVAETIALKDFDVVNWTALLAPAGTPRPIVEKLARETDAALHDPALLQRLETLGLDPAGEGPDALAQEIRRTVAQWRANRGCR